MAWIAGRAAIPLRPGRSMSSRTTSGGALCDHAQRAGGIAGDLRGVAERGERFLEDRAELDVVVDDQDATARGRGLRRAGGRRRRRGRGRPTERGQDVARLNGLPEDGDRPRRQGLCARRSCGGPHDHHPDARIEQPDSPQHFEAGDAGEVERDDHRCGANALDVEQGFQTVLGLEHLVPVPGAARPRSCARASGSASPITIGRVASLAGVVTVRRAKSGAADHARAARAS